MSTTSHRGDTVVVPVVHVPGVNAYFDTAEEAELHCPETHYVVWLHTAYAVLPYTPYPAAPRCARCDADDYDDSSYWL